MASVSSIVDAVHALSSHEPRAYYEEWPTVQSVVRAPVPFDRPAFERSIGGRLPADLGELYELTGGMQLFKDVERSWSGIEIFSPGDFVFAEANGVAWKLVIRCDPPAEDFGHVLFADEMDGRDEWRTIARSLAEFLERYVENRGHPYWPGFETPGKRLA